MKSHRLIRVFTLVYFGYRSTRSIKYTVSILLVRLAGLVSHSDFGNKIFKHRARNVAAYLVSKSTSLLGKQYQAFDLFYSMMVTQTRNSFFREGSQLASQVYGMSLSHSIDFSQKYEIVKSAAYDSNIRLLEEIASNDSWTGCHPGFSNFIRGIIQFSFKSPGWSDQFQLSKEKYESSLLDDIIKTNTELPEMYHNSRNFLCSRHVEQVFLDVELLGTEHPEPNVFLDKSVREMLVLVSCDETYFLIFIDNFMKNLRKHNKNLVIIILVKDSGSLTELTKKIIEELISADSKCIIELRITEFNPGLLSSLERFISAEATSNSYNSDVLIVDIDLSIDFCLNDYFMSATHDISCVIHHGVCVPWARYNAGVFHFRRTSDALNIIRLSIAYANRMLSDNGGWTLDQSALTLAIHFYSSIGRCVVIRNISPTIPMRWSAKTPYEFYRKRARGKLEIMRQ